MSRRKLLRRRRVHRNYYARCLALVGGDYEHMPSPRAYDKIAKREWRETVRLRVARRKRGVTTR